jgi:hypothetical protein
VVQAYLITTPHISERNEKERLRTSYDIKSPARDLNRDTFNIKLGFQLLNLDVWSVNISFQLEYKFVSSYLMN